MNDFYVSQSEQHKLRVKISDCSTPADLKHLQFINEHFDKEGNLERTSTYEFFLKEPSIIHLANKLLHP